MKMRSELRDYQNRLVGNPGVFPAPVIYQCELKNVSMKIHELYTNVDIIVSSSKVCYEIGREIKAAIFGSVHCGYILNHLGDDNYERTNQMVAIKKMAIKKISEKSGKAQEDPMREIAALQYLGNKNPNVINQIECTSNSEFLFSVMKFCHGCELYEHVDVKGRIAEADARTILKQLVNGLEYLHSIHICHRDLTLENIIISNNLELTIIDVGMCLKIPHNSETNEDMLIHKQGVCGKKNYIAPEILQDDEVFDGCAVDVWSLGIVLFTLLAGFPPVEAASPLDRRYRLIKDGKLTLMLSKWNISMCDACVNLLEGMLKPNPAERMTLKQIKEHAWVTAI